MILRQDYSKWHTVKYMWGGLHVEKQPGDKDKEKS
jgi:hypothetical protein